MRKLNFYVLLFSMFILILMIVATYLFFSAESNTALYEFSKLIIPTLATLLGAAIVLFVFLYQKETDKLKALDLESKNNSNIAAIIYLELKSIEKSINNIKEDFFELKVKRQVNTSMINENSPQILISNTWKMNKHLFIDMLSTDSYVFINNAFEIAEMAEDCRKWSIDIYRSQAEQKAKSQTNCIINTYSSLVIEKVRGDFFGEQSANGIIVNSENIGKLKDAYGAELYNMVSMPSNIFRLQELADKSEQLLEKFHPIINTPAGAELKEIAKMTLN
ncbi:TPA: hypothetical protein ACPY94_003019 [Yersinia enterocolitica]|uniref:hypothetical protein n=1 Tax=Yersinia enterocolitica TaxID=630 RepID=UPI001F59C3DE|nr:hypothetical protein [Yersinia enterocolitica]